MRSYKRWQILALIIMCCIGFAFGIWLLRAGFILIGCLFIGLFLWRGQQFVIWFIVPSRAPSDVTPSLNSPGQKLVLSVVCLLAPPCVPWVCTCVFGYPTTGKPVLYLFFSA